MHRCIVSHGGVMTSWICECMNEEVLYYIVFDSHKVATVFYKWSSINQIDASCSFHFLLDFVPAFTWIQVMHRHQNLIDLLKALELSFFFFSRIHSLLNLISRFIYLSRWEVMAVNAFHDEGYDPVLCHRHSQCYDCSLTRCFSLDSTWAFIC